MVRYELPIAHPEEVKINFCEHKGFTWVTPEDALTMKLMRDEDRCIQLIYQENWRSPLN